MAFDPLRNPVDVVELDGHASPGIATIRNAAALREWVERQGYGSTGGFAFFKRRKNAHFTIEFRLYTPEQWDDWHVWSDVVYRMPTKRGGAVPASGYIRIYHPLLEDLDIKSVGVEKIGQPEQVEDGVWMFPVDFLEFRAPKITLVKPEATTPAAAEDPYEVAIAALRAENEALTGKLARGK